MGIDPGTLVTGYGVISCEGDGSFVLLEAGAIRNPSERPIPQRLKRIYEGLQAVILRVHPDECAVESAFYGKNAQSALKLGQARGACLLTATIHGLPVGEYSPREVKQAVVGSGGASKQQVQYMVKTMLHLQEAPSPLDVSDAIAVAICHSHRRSQGRNGTHSWKSFIAAHPERIVS